MTNPIRVPIRRVIQLGGRRQPEAGRLDLAAITDEELLTLVARGDPPALEEVYNRHSRAVFSLARYMLREQGLAEEVTQEVFLSVWRRAASFEPSRGRGYTWIMGIAHNRVVDELRRIRRSPVPAGQEETDLAWQTLASSARTDEQAHANLERERVLGALQGLPEEQRRVVMLSYYEGYSHSEIAEKLGQPLGTVKTRLRLALQKLRATLGGAEET